MKAVKGLAAAWLVWLRLLSSTQEAFWTSSPGGFWTNLVKERQSYAAHGGRGVSEELGKTVNIFLYQDFGTQESGGGVPVKIQAVHSNEHEDSFFFVFVIMLCLDMTQTKPEYSSGSKLRLSS